ncbi:MAG: cytochrome c3 family protein [Myxococcaceae bacterium]|nr:cytochrome c3 family protein [Myxococcaceae bacterium]
MKRLGPGVVAVLLASACTKSLLTHFPHRQHLAELACGAPGQPDCLSCASCHQGATDSFDGGVGVATGAWHPPRVESCSACHQDAPQTFSRSIRPAIATVPAGKAIVFAHDPHLAMPSIKGQCVTCHAGAVGVTGGAPLFPPMEACLSCHEHRRQFDSGTCTNCHRQSDLRGLRPVSFLSHDAAWTRRHGLIARSEPERCESCHAQTSCDSCHDATRPMSAAVRNPEKFEAELVHRFDFLTQHAVEAESQPGTCLTCHAQPDCDACHTARGVSPMNRGAVSPHPAGWASGTGAARNTHGPAARRNLLSCAACHDQGAASTCVRCHRVGGSGGTPHPAGWQGSAPMGAPECQACHGGAL